MSPSKIEMSAVNPARARSADCTPQRAAWPAWKGLVMVPKLRSSPDAWEAARPSALRSWATLSPSRRAAAAAVANTPVVAVLCQPRW